ncbi:MAG TPA: hypothetical protein PKC72_10380 [Chitinophagaceae bacterium]|nr:hypothetical protein [Chitinophagaceae bacterium]
MKLLFVLPLALFSFFITNEKTPYTSYTITQEKIITIVATADGMVYIGNDSMTTEELTKELKTRFWKSYLGSGKLYDRIKLSFEGEVLMGTRGAVMDAIAEGQKLALKDICLEKHKKLFEDLSAKQQAKLKKQFPILFQTDFH